VKEGKSRHQAVFWGVIVGGVLITAAVISLYAPGLRLLDLREIVVSGNRYVSAAEVANATGLKAGDSLLAISPRNVSELVSSLPWVKAATVRRVYPHRLSICVQERVVDATGRSGTTLPELVGAPLSGEGPGASLLDRRVIDLVDSLAFDARLRGMEIRRIDVSDPASIFLYTDTCPMILLGGLDGFAARLDALAALSRAVDLGSYESIDLRLKGEATLVRR